MTADGLERCGGVEDDRDGLERRDRVENRPNWAVEKTPEFSRTESSSRKTVENSRIAG